MTKPHVNAAGETHPGGRPSNQDTFLVEPQLGLYAVLDGMGGHAAGEVASKLARDALVEFTRQHSHDYSPCELVEFGIDCAAASVFRAAKDKPAYRGMGTTVVACLVSRLASEQDEIIVGHVGDSRAYLLRDGQLHLLTHDHNMAQQLRDAGRDIGRPPNEDELKAPANILTRNLGDEHGATPDMLEMPLRTGDRILLCTDGLSNCVSAEAIQCVLGSNGTPHEIARALVEMALSSGEATDNITVLVISNGAGMAQLEPDHQAGAT